MDDETQAQQKLTQRQQDAAELLWGDGRLRESLPDEQAAQLLDWAARYVKSEINLTADWPDEEADEYADQVVTAVRRLLIHVNQLVTDLPDLREAEAEAEVSEFVNRLHELMGQDVFPAQFDLLAPDRQNWDKTQVFQQIMDILTAEPEEE